MNKVINRFDGTENAWLSNFYPCDVWYDGLKYPSSENAYQAAKTLDMEERKKFQTMEAGQSKRAGRKLTLREDWEDVKILVMASVLMSKFRDNKNLGEKLIDTHDTMLIEGNTWNDTFWGVCDGKGKNMLGKTLMEIRTLIGTFDF